MNKYQEYLLKGILSSNFLFYRCCLIGEFSNAKKFYGKFDKDNDTFTITQDDDINLVEYSLIIWEKIDFIENVYIWKNKQWEKVANTEIELTNSTGKESFPCYRIDVDFRNRIDKLRFTFKGELADDYILKLQYVEADKEAYYAEQAKTARENLIKTAAIKHSTGNDLVNIYFQPCCDEYQRTEISLYHDGQMLAKYKVEDGAYFKSIGGLAYGTYEYIVKQFGKNDKLLLETEKIKFSISRPNYGGEHIVVI